MKKAPVRVKTKLELKISQCLEEFYIMMNEKAVELELTNSHFAVAHGMHHDENYSTAHDISILSCHAM